MTDANGEINYDRVRSLVAVIACVAGLVLACGAVIWQLSGHSVEDKELLGWIIMALVLPITGGTVAGKLAGKNGTNGNYPAPAP